MRTVSVVLGPIFVFLLSCGGSSEVVLLRSVEEVVPMSRETVARTSNGAVFLLRKDVIPSRMEAPTSVGIREGGIGDCWSISTGGELVALNLPYGIARAPSVITVQPGLALLGGGFVRQSDGRTLHVHVEEAKLVESPVLAGASSCTSDVCLIRGDLLDLASSLRQQAAVHFDVGRKVLEITSSSWVKKGGIHFDRGTVALGEDGRLFTVSALSNYYDLSSHIDEITGLPPIRHLHPGFYEDGSHRIWYWGIAPRGWPSELLSDDVPRHACEADHPKQDPIERECVDAVAIPALANTRPVLVLDESYRATVYAIFPDGTLRCWASEGAYACPRGEE